jgi:RNA 2',3'-cyclic 3'-phosphodiesterase
MSDSPPSNAPTGYRLFVALSVPFAVKHELQSAQNQLREVLQISSVRWTRPEQFHVTLKFLGNVDVTQLIPLVHSLKLACAPLPPLYLRAQSIGFFPNSRRPNVIWAGISDSHNYLSTLHANVAKAVQPFIDTPARDEKFSAHLTLGRISHLHRREMDRLSEMAATLNARIFGEWTISQIELMRSELTVAGAVHTCHAELPLAGHPTGH